MPPLGFGLPPLGQKVKGKPNVCGDVKVLDHTATEICMFADKTDLSFPSMWELPVILCVCALTLLGIWCALKGYDWRGCIYITVHKTEWYRYFVRFLSYWLLYGVCKDGHLTLCRKVELCGHTCIYVCSCRSCFQLSFFFSLCTAVYMYIYTWCMWCYALSNTHTVVNAQRECMYSVSASLHTLGCRRHCQDMELTLECIYTVQWSGR